MNKHLAGDYFPDRNIIRSPEAIKTFARAFSCLDIKPYFLVLVTEIALLSAFNVQGAETDSLVTLDSNRQCASNPDDSSIEVEYEVVAKRLEVPWALASTGDGRLFITERGGSIRVYSQDSGLREEPWATIPVVNKGVVGLMGIAVSPNFKNNGYVYVLGTYQATADNVLSQFYNKAKKIILSGLFPDIGYKYRNRLYRLRDNGKSGVELDILREDIPSDIWHGTSSMAFGPDNLLYISTGDSSRPDLAQSERSLAGKILRLSEDGEAAPNNLVSGSAIYASGFRNSQGFDWSVHGKLYASEHGEVGNDELNVISENGSYGWPNTVGNDIANKKYIRPVYTWDEGIAPSGVVNINRPGHAWHNSLLVAGLKSKQLRRLVLDESAIEPRIVCEDVIMSGSLGRLRSLHQGKDGQVYLTTSNRDKRGSPHADDDRLVRLIFPG